MIAEIALQGGRIYVWSFYSLTGSTFTALIMSRTSSPTSRFNSSTDSVVVTDAISAGVVTSNLISDIIPSLLIEVTLALILFLAPCLACCIC
jgi:hypothetical protein